MKFVVLKEDFTLGVGEVSDESTLQEASRNIACGDVTKLDFIFPINEKPYVMLVNEDGASKDFDKNTFASRLAEKDIFGKAIVIQSAGSNWMSIPDEEIELFRYICNMLRKKAVQK